MANMDAMIANNANANNVNANNANENANNIGAGDKYARYMKMKNANAGETNPDGDAGRMNPDDLILELKDVSVHFKLNEGLLKAIDGVDFEIYRGKTLGIVGESGCGKSVTSNAILQLLPKYSEVGGQILLWEKNGERLKQPIDIAVLERNSPEIRSIRGRNISMIFQEPMKAFSPILTIGEQVTEPIMLHITQNRAEADKIAVDMFRKVGISNPEQRLSEYPHQLSGGMRQRAMIAMALSSNPAILIADEPTTALDVTIQAQVLQLINQLKTNIGTSVIFITHNLGVIAEMSDYVAVMYLGKIVEYTDVDTLFNNPAHPYTTALMAAIPSVIRKQKSMLKSIPGIVPVPMNLPPGCGFYGRCDFAEDGLCNVGDVPLIEFKPGHKVRCVKCEEAYVTANARMNGAPAAADTVKGGATA